MVAICGGVAGSFTGFGARETGRRAVPGSHKYVATATPHHGQAYGSLVAPEGAETPDMYPVNWDDIANDGTGPPISIWQDPTKDEDPPEYYGTHHCYLERPIKGLIADSWVAFKSATHTDPIVFRVDQTDEVSVTGFALSAKTSGLRLTAPDGTAITRDDTLAVRTTTAYSNSERLALADIPDRLLVVGGGYVGLELGMVYAALGSRVSLVERQNRLLTGVDADLVGPQRRAHPGIRTDQVRTEATR